MYEYRIKENYMFIITEYINGVRLSDLNNHSKMFTKNSNDELADFYFMCVQIFDALTFIHFHGIAHRDLHSENILLQNDRMRIKLIDFGLACKVPSITNKILDDINHTPTIKCIKGGRTQLFYTAPELLNSHGANSDFDLKLMISSDVWGLGLTLHQLVVNHFPISFPTGKNLTTKMINLLATEFYIDPNEFYFSGIFDMISEMLNMDPKKRITASQLQKLSVKNWCDVIDKKPNDIMQSDIRPINHLWGNIGGTQFKSMKSKYKYENEHYKMLE
jgi:serine/threonine protein kinase